MSQQKKKITIALDIMGGDNAPIAALSGADQISRYNQEVQFLLFGKKDIITKHLVHYSALAKHATIHHAESVIDNDEKPSIALRKGKNTSMRLAISAIKESQAQAMVSAGNTGALMAIAKVILRTLPGIDRPAIASLFPTRTGNIILLDLGANIDCNAENLVQFAIMGDAFAKIMLGKVAPRIGLLNVGSEETKGSEIVRAAAEELKEGVYNLNFHGYVEGNDIAEGTTDVVVTDGFTGNIALKTAEGTAKICGDYIKQALTSSLLARIGGCLARVAIKKAFKSLDPRLHNGAMFLGLNGIVVKSHGGTDHVGYKNAIEVAIELAKNNINQKITEELSLYEDPPEELFET